MSRILLLIALLAGWLLLTGTATAQQALVKNYQNASLEIGQGYLTHYGGTCYLLLPSHVAEEAGSVAALLGEGSAPRLGETSGFAELGDDVTLATVVGSLSDDCGFGTMSISRAIDGAVSANGLAIVRSVNGDGTIAQLSVTLFDDDGSTFIRVQPSNADNQLRKGQSGSLLMAGDTPIGMLLSVDARFGMGKVIRLDAMLAKVDDHLVELAASAATSEAEGLTVSRWTAMAVDDAHRAVNLVARDESAGWRARVEQWPAVVEFDLGGRRVAVSGITLDGRVDEPAALPAELELQISSTTDGERWRSVAGGPVTFLDGRASIAVAPTWARRIRLVLSRSVADPDHIALRRVQVLLSD